MSEGRVYISRQNKYYHENIKADPEKYAKEREKVRTILKNRYHNDEDYKQHKREQALANYYKRKERANIPIIV